MIQQSTTSSTVKDKDKDKKKEKIACSTCEKDFNSHFNYNRHVAKCKAEKNECVVCNCVFNSHDELQEHQMNDRLHIGKILICQQEGCYTPFTTKKGLDYHVGTHKMKTFNCEACGQLFDSHEFFSAHKKKQKSTRKIPKQQHVRVVSASFMASMRQNATLTLVVISIRQEK